MDTCPELATNCHCQWQVQMTNRNKSTQHKTNILKTLLLKHLLKLIGKFFNYYTWHTEINEVATEYFNATLSAFVNKIYSDI